MLSIHRNFFTLVIRRFFIFSLLLFFTANNAQAHKLNMFAYVEGEDIYIEVYFADGKRAKNSKIKVYDPQSQLLYSSITDDKGGHQFAIPQKTELRIVVDAGMGHQTEYTLPVSEFSDEQNSNIVATNVKTSSQQTADVVTETAPAITASAPLNMDMDQLKPLITRAVSQAVKPLQREISELKNKTSVSDLIGGVGYIFGLLGLFAYMDARKKSNKVT